MKIGDRVKRKFVPNCITNMYEVVDIIHPIGKDKTIYVIPINGSDKIIPIPFNESDIALFDWVPSTPIIEPHVGADAELIRLANKMAKRFGKSLQWCERDKGFTEWLAYVELAEKLGVYKNV